MGRPRQKLRMTELEEDGEDITENVDTDALGEDIKESSTEDPTLQEETMGEGTEQAGDSGDTGIPEATEDGTALDGTAQDDGVVVPEEGSGEAVLDGTAQDDGVVAPEEGTEIPAEGEITEDPLNTDALTEEGKASFEKAQSFCKGEYEGDTAALQSVMGDTAAASVTIAPETGAQLTEKVLEAYINVLKDGGLSFIPAETGPYMSAELNMVNTSLKTIFSIEADTG